jgi:AcrR family transcriptional regulator
MTRSRPRGRDEVVAAVLDAAERLFALRGPAQVSLREIAHEAQVNIGLIHRHIGSKDALVSAVLDRFRREGVERVHAVGSWDELVDLAFTPTQHFFDYTDLLAWLLLEGVEPTSLTGGESPLDRVVDGQADEAATALDVPRDAVAALLAMAYGWQLFGPYIARTLRYSEDEAAELGRRVAARAAELAPRVRSGA